MGRILGMKLRYTINSSRWFKSWIVDHDQELLKREVTDQGQGPTTKWYKWTEDEEWKEVSHHATLEVAFQTIAKRLYFLSRQYNKSMKKPIPIEICCDCLQWIANGEGPEDNPNDWTPPEGEYTLGWLHYPEDHDPEDQDNLGFSWSSCDACNSHLGGDRYAASIWIESDKTITTTNEK